MNMLGLFLSRFFAYVNNIPVENMDELTTMIVNNIELEWDKFNPKTKKYHWNYKGGITPENKEIRASLKYQIWRRHI